MWIVGTHRYVWIVGSIVVKIPRIKLTYVFWWFPKWCIREIIKSKTPFYRNKFLWSDIWGRFKKNTGLNGLMENIREVKCYLITRHKLLTPLYFPLIILNIYKREKGVGYINLDRLAIKIENPEYIEDQKWLKTFRKCLHTFEDDNNFAYNGKSVKIIDYGEKGFQELLTKYGDQVEKLLSSVTKSLK